MVKHGKATNRLGALLFAGLPMLRDNAPMVLHRESMTEGYGRRLHSIWSHGKLTVLMGTSEVRSTRRGEVKFYAPPRTTGGEGV